MPTILILDDESISRKILSVLAGSINDSHEIKTFACPQEALDWVTKHPVALMVTDYKMPGMNGTEFIRLCRSQTAGPQIPVIMVSADDEPGLREKALEAGATDLLEKPVSPYEFRELCRALLENVT